jgi:hypothetical protein
MNPPYDKNLHLKILREAMKHSDDVVNLSPIYWLSYVNRDNNEFNDIKARIASLDIIKAGSVEKLFGADFPSDLGIYCITPKGGWTPDYSLIDKIMKKAGTAVIDENKKDGWRVRISKVGGKMNNHRKSNELNNLGKLLYFYDGLKDGKPWYDFYQKNKWSKTTPEITNSIKFNSEDEAKNFISSLTETKLGKWVEDKLCEVTYIKAENIFWLPTYTHPWTDEMLYKYFALTDEEIQEIEKCIS